MRTFLCAMCVLVVSLATLQAQEFTVGDYWRLTGAQLVLSVEEWKDRIVAAEQAHGNSQQLLARSNAITKQYATARKKLLAQYSISELGYLHYSTDHGREVESFLAENDEIRGQIEGFRQQVQSLSRTFDQVAASMLGGDRK